MSRDGWEVSPDGSVMPDGQVSRDGSEVSPEGPVWVGVAIRPGLPCAGMTRIPGRLALRLPIAALLGTVAVVLVAPLVPLGAQTSPPQPDARATAEARRELRARFATAYADSSPDGRRTLAVLLWRERHAPMSPAQSHALFSEVRDLAVEVGEVDLALDAVDELVRRLGLDADAARTAAKQQLLRRQLAPPQAAVLARRARALVDPRLDRDDFDGALRIASIAEQAARRSGDLALQAEMALLEDFCRDVLRQAPRYREALKVLQDDPMNAAANQRAGEFLIAVKQEWGRALVMLSRGTDAGLREASAAELGGARGGELARAADAWARWAGNRRGPARMAAFSHARRLYERALPDLAEADRDRVLREIAEIVMLASRPGRPPELIDARSVRRQLGESRWAWVEGLSLGEFRLRDDAGELVSSQAILEWSPRTDDFGDLLPPPEADGGPGGNRGSDGAGGRGGGGG